MEVRAMALTEYEARVLGRLAALAITNSVTVSELCRQTGLTESSARKALMRLSRIGLVYGSTRGPARWRSTDRGRRAISRPAYREYTRGRPC
ncbi:helix-turn-helix domain-containing protein [Nocardia sp. NPDC058058]|uniref:helix-turn-helix domain-containing protein n=1 Tax=Nocardia sp. NPDC058058 TaxID=3346317 RepID=UPI0036D9F131